jgi:hypothetical protein
LPVKSCVHTLAFPPKSLATKIRICAGHFANDSLPIHPLSLYTFRNATPNCCTSLHNYSCENLTSLSTLTPALLPLHTCKLGTPLSDIVCNQQNKVIGHNSSMISRLKLPTKTPFQLLHNRQAACRNKEDMRRPLIKRLEDVTGPLKCSYSSPSHHPPARTPLLCAPNCL